MRSVFCLTFVSDLILFLKNLEGKDKSVLSGACGLSELECPLDLVVLR